MMRMSCELYKGISRPIDAFVKYFLDVKPYHTKILEILEKYKFNESLEVGLAETTFTNITFMNEPLCSMAGFGVDWDNKCGFDALSCCDLFDCIGGYGLIYDNSDLLVSAPVVSVDNVNDQFVVAGNLTYDVKLQISNIISPTSFSIKGDSSALFQTHSIFLIVPKHTYNVLSSTSTGFNVSGNRVNEFITKNDFIVYAGNENDGHYHTKTAIYDFDTNTTFVEVLETINVVNTNTGIIEIDSDNKNNGVYQVENVIFNGVNTVVTVKTSVKQFGILTDTNHGSVQFRTGFIYPRTLTLEETVIPVANNTYKVLESKYDYVSDVTLITVIRNLEDLVPDGVLKLYGYAFSGGFDGDEDCSSPKDSNVHALFSEILQITVIPQP